MKDKNKKKTKFWKSFSIFVLIFLIIKVGVRLIKENVKKFTIDEKDDLEK